MATVSVDLRNIEGTQAALGWAGSHTVVADRPDGVAGGQGLGFNGAELLALALGGCFCNDLRYVAHDLGVRLGAISVSAAITLEGKPPIATSARIRVSCVTLDGTDPARIVEQARASCMVSNSLSRGVPVAIEMAD